MQICFYFDFQAGLARYDSRVCKEDAISSAPRSLGSSTAFSAWAAPTWVGGQVHFVANKAAFHDLGIVGFAVAHQHQMHKVLSPYIKLSGPFGKHQNLEINSSLWIVALAEKARQPFLKVKSIDFPSAVTFFGRFFFRKGKSSF